MVMAASSAALSFAGLLGGSHFQTRGLQSKKLKKSVHCQTQLAIDQNKRVNHHQNSSICAKHSDDSRCGTGDFLAGFLLGEAVFGTLGYAFAPQLRGLRSWSNVATEPAKAEQETEATM